MYKLFVVDDDETERRGICALPFLADAGIEVMGEAWNGLEALSRCEALLPDIVLTDVRMPVMDGLTFVARLKEIHKGVKVLFMSGYEDFDAVKQAMAIGAEAYLTKPVSVDELRQKLQDITGTMDWDHHQSLENQRLRERERLLIPVLRERLLRDLLLNVRDLNDEQTAREAREVGGPMLDQKLSVLAVQVHAREGCQQVYMRAHDLLKATYDTAGDVEMVPVHGGLNALIVPLPSGLNDERSFDYLQARAMDAFSILHGSLNCRVTVAVSAVGECANQLGSLYLQAMSALQKQALYSANRIYWYEHMCEKGPLPDVASTARQLEKNMLAGDEDGLFRTLDAFLSAMRGADASLENVRILCMDLIFRHTILSHEDGKDFLSLFENREIPYPAIMGTETADEIQVFLKDLFTRAMSALYMRPVSQAEHLVRRVQEIIGAQYMGYLTTDTIAKEVFLTPSHLRRVFKNLTGQTIQDYILVTRMSKARALLMDSQMKVFEVAHAVGYENHSYFSIAFKKYFGKAPGEFRNEPS